MENQDQTTAAKELWADEADEQIRYGKGFHWVESTIVLEHMNVRISGDRNLNWVQYSAQQYMQPRSAPRVLSLGCGGGALERDLLRLKPDSLITAMDFSPGAIDLAQRRAEEAGVKIDYRVADFNQIELEPTAYDFVFASGALHHLANLEHALRQVRSSLRADGLLIANEYVGPKQLQWTPRQVQTINDILALLPDPYRRRVSSPAEYKREFSGPSSVAEMNRHDPTEAVRSDEIVPMVEKLFQVVELKPFGGTLLHMLLQDIVGNFSPAVETDACILKLICYLEQQLINAGFLASDFAFVVAAVRPDGNMHDAIGWKKALRRFIRTP